MLESFFLLLSMALAIVTALWVVFSKNTIHSALWMVGFCLIIAVLFVFLHLDFIAMLQIVVYAGAIMMFIVYSVLLLNLREEEGISNILKTKLFGIFLLICFILTLSPFIQVDHALQENGGIFTLKLLEHQGEVPYLAVKIFSDYLVAFELVSILLTAGVVGAIALAKKGGK